MTRTAIKFVTQLARNLGSEKQLDTVVLRSDSTFKHCLHWFSDVVVNSGLARYACLHTHRAEPSEVFYCTLVLESNFV